MTNKTGRYFVVGESELERLAELAELHGRLTPRDIPNKEYRKAEAACRVREVISCEPSYKDTWVEVKK